MIRRLTDTVVVKMSEFSSFLLFFLFPFDSDTLLSLSFSRAYTSCNDLIMQSSFPYKYFISFLFFLAGIEKECRSHQQQTLVNSNWGIKETKKNGEKIDDLNRKTSFPIFRIFPKVARRGPWTFFFFFSSLTFHCDWVFFGGRKKNNKRYTLDVIRFCFKKKILLSSPSSVKQMKRIWKNKTTNLGALCKNEQTHVLFNDWRRKKDVNEEERKSID